MRFMYWSLILSAPAVLGSFVCLSHQNISTTTTSSNSHPNTISQQTHTDELANPTPESAATYINSIDPVGKNKRNLFAPDPRKSADPLNFCSEWPGTKPQKHDTCIIIVNATPYRWRRGYVHSYQMQRWTKEKWPKFIEPGQVLSFYAKQGGGWNYENTAAEVAYHLEGTKRPMSFMVEYRRGKEHHTWVRFLEDLQTSKNPKGSEINLGFRTIPHAVSFILAGEDDDFITNDGPPGWMQHMLPEIGHVPLKQIVMGRSHHAGTYKADSYGFGNNGNSQTQKETLYQQLVDGGIRVIDVRTMRVIKDRKHKFHECHGAAIIDGWSGIIGASFDEMIDQVNKFNDDHPGELIIWDLHPSQTWTRRPLAPGYAHWKGGLNAKGRSQLYESLKKLNHRVKLPPNTDITTLPLRDFIGHGRPAVIIRINQDWVDDKSNDTSFPGPSEGFVTQKIFPVQTRWSNAPRPNILLPDQLEALRLHRPRRDAKLYDMQWILTKQDLDNLLLPDSIVDLANALWGKAFQHLWGVSTVDQYPNWITVDAIRGNEFKALVMAMNKCFAAKGCGDWAKKERLFEYLR